MIVADVEIYSPGGMCDGINVYDRDMLILSRRKSIIFECPNYRKNLKNLLFSGIII